MTDFARVVSIIVVYRITIVVIGLGFAYLGYRLFALGLYEKAGELKAAWGESRLELKQAAPGIFFALFGAALILASLVRGVDIERIRTLSASQDTASTQSPNGGASGRGASTTADSSIPLPTSRNQGAASKKSPLADLFTAENDPEIKNLIDLTKVRPLTKEEYEKLKTWFQVQESIHIIARQPGSSIEELINKGKS